MVYLLLAGVLLSWILQTVLGSFQIKNFNKRYSAMRSTGRVAIGRSKGIIRAGVVLLLAVDEDNQIVEAEKMQGVTILARFRKVHPLVGQSLLSIDSTIYSKMDRFTKLAIDDAIQVYKTVSRGEEVKPIKSPLGRLATGFRK
ncbi:transcriptional regulator GutM [Pseudalkalibacillus hwajinpoensis]|uniref:transcriptional regulator GutM n=1 Tax=Guptibacillus hwajinpoensis TaxID=208199 RepID=UPI00325AAA13